MSQVDSDFEAVEFGNAFEETPGAEQPQDVVAKPVTAYRKQEFNVYSMLLILSFLMLIISIIFLFIEVGRFEK